MKFLIAVVAVIATVSAVAEKDDSRFKWTKVTEPLPEKVSRNLLANPIAGAKFTHNKYPKMSPKFATPTRITPAQQGECGIENLPSEKVVGGTEAAPNQFPWLVEVYCDDFGNSYFCTGSLISEDWVLTAGHCVVCNNYILAVGGHSSDMNDESDGKYKIESDDSTQHPDYSQFTLHGDIGLIRLPEPAPLYLDTVTLSCLPDNTVTDLFTGDLCTVTGWGKISDSALTVSDVVNFAKDREVIENDECAIHYSATVYEGTICINAEDGAGVCSGDSGGPLNLQPASPEEPYIQIGVTSFVSSQGCESGNPHGFARVTYFREWITENSGV